jgi:hypothetical protein
MKKTTRANAGRAPISVLMLALALPALPACDSDLEPPPPFPGAVEGQALLGVYEGRFPCDGQCQRLKTALALFQDPAARAPTIYQMREIPVGNDDGIRDSRGAWTVVRGAPASPDAPVYVLQPEAAPGSAAAAPVHYLRFDDNLLLLLDQALNARVGNASHSFTLSRTR